MFTYDIHIFYFYPVVVLWDSWICGSVSDTHLGVKLSHYHVTYFFCSFLAFLSLCYSCYTYSTPFVVVQCSVFFLIFLLFTFLFWKFFFRYPRAQGSFSQLCQSVVGPFTGIFYLHSVLLISSVYLWLFLRICLSVLTICLFFYVVYFFPVRVLSTLIIVILKSWSDSSSIPVTADCGSGDGPVSSNWLLPF